MVVHRPNRQSPRLLAWSTAVALLVVPAAAPRSLEPTTAGTAPTRAGTSNCVDRQGGRVLTGMQETETASRVSGVVDLSHSYDWPLKPFDRAHPVRGFLNDPRIYQRSEAFHFGIDIVARDGTAVYAVEAGRVFFDSPTAIAVVSP